MVGELRSRSMHFVSVHAAVNRFAWDSEIFQREFFPSNVYWHVFLDAGISYGATA